MHVTKLYRGARTLRLNVAVALAFAALTVLVTYPQVRGFATSVPYHSDPYFSAKLDGTDQKVVLTGQGSLTGTTVADVTDPRGR